MAVDGLYEGRNGIPMWMSTQQNNEIKNEKCFKASIIFDRRKVEAGIQQDTSLNPRIRNTESYEPGAATTEPHSDRSIAGNIPSRKFSGRFSSVL